MTITLIVLLMSCLLFAKPLLGSGGEPTVGRCDLIRLPSVTNLGSAAVRILTIR